MEIKSLILGFFLGILFVIIVIYIFVYFLNRKFIKKSLESNNIDNNDINSIIVNKQRKILKSKKIGLSNNINLMNNLIREVIFDIAKYYYPESKNPHYEISLIEALDMNERITERLKKIIDNKVFTIIKDIRISQIIKIMEYKKVMENKKIYNLSKKYNLQKVVSYSYTALNIASPSYWIRKLIYTSTLETTLRGIGIMTINIVGEEATHLYSKKIIDNRDILLDKEIKKFIKEIEMSHI